eukprot:CAMPEP_0114501132 /NCGR_PEP_ID=MMETSP0109-20121206/8335_1 /TAXON_ID=29199 /ORGANISM="Chlorarachnion reptans, Strain CCCM449" /LENGTH=287 /DNA_ID=CAMNT_0001678841 /DNA_START=27 /DNA_END=891 /DNA_ORIENTATION=+
MAYVAASQCSRGRLLIPRSVKAGASSGGGAQRRWKNQYYYGIRDGKDGFSGVVKDWGTCSGLVTGISNAKHKRFDTEEEASTSAGPAGKRRPAAPRKAAPKKRQRQPPAPAEEGEAFEDAMNVYTDGACEGNGRKEALAGYGVWFGEDGPDPISEALEGPLQTNQRAELTAVVKALGAIVELSVAAEEAGEEDLKPVVIWSDSAYTVKGSKSWVPNWKRNNWQTANKMPVKNKDLWTALDENLAQLRKYRKVELRWVRGHQGNHGNEMADSLAVEGILKHDSTKEGY